MSNIIFEAKDISKDYIQGEICIEALKNLNLKVKKSEIVSIVGASGSGKSSFLQIAGLLDSVYEGDIIISGKTTKNLKDSSREKLRLNNIGFVYQFHHLLKDFNARENIAMPGFIACKDHEKSLKEADLLLESLGMFERRFHFPGQLSGGEQQRVAIARSLFNKPDIIFADEPTGNLDPETGNVVFELFLKMAREFGIAIIIVTHNAELAKRADADYALKHGELCVI